MSVVFWLLAALLPVLYFKKTAYKSMAFLITFLLFAAREVGLHKTFTSDSFLKINYYKNGLGLEQFIGGAFAIFSISMVLFVIISIIRYVFFKKAWRALSGQCLFIACALLFFTKIMDRAPALLRNNFAVHLPAKTQDISTALEEGLEMIIPVLFILALALKPNIFTGSKDDIISRRKTVK